MPYWKEVRIINLANKVPGVGLIKSEYYFRVKVSEKIKIFIFFLRLLTEIFDASTFAEIIFCICFSA